MTKIIIKNAGTCVNPVLTKVHQVVSSGSEFPTGMPLLIFYFQAQSINAPSTIYFEYTLNGGSSWTLLVSKPADLVSSYYVLGYITIPPNGTLCRARVVNDFCGERTSNSSPTVF